VDDRDSFAHVENWLGQVKDLADNKVQMLLVANKLDIPARVVSS
jgi:GTPase SAR1 family protein